MPVLIHRFDKTWALGEGVFKEKGCQLQFARRVGAGTESQLNLKSIEAVPLLPCYRILTKVATALIATTINPPNLIIMRCSS